MNPTCRLGVALLLASSWLASARAQDLPVAELERRAQQFVLANAGPDGRWHAVDGAESPLTAFLVRGESSVRLATLARFAISGPGLQGFNPARERLVAVRTGQYVENTLHVSRLDARTGSITYVGGILFVDLPSSIDDPAAFEAQALKPYGLTFADIDSGDVYEDEFLDRILKGARELALEPPPASLVITPRPGARSAYLFDSPVLEGRQGRLLGGTPVRIVHREQHEGRRWVYVKTEPDAAGRVREGWIPAERVGRAQEPAGSAGLSGSLGGAQH